MTKPIGSLCNVNSTYCYYLGKKYLFSNLKGFRMFDEILEKYIV